MKSILILSIIFSSLLISSNESYEASKVKHYSKKNNGLSNDGKTIYRYVEGKHTVKTNNISLGSVKQTNLKKGLTVNSTIDGLDVFGKQKISKYKTKILEKREENSTVSRIGEVDLTKDKNKDVKEVNIYLKNVQIRVK